MGLLVDVSHLTVSGISNDENRAENRGGFFQIQV